MSASNTNNDLAGEARAPPRRVRQRIRRELSAEVCLDLRSDIAAVGGFRSLCPLRSPGVEVSE